jgi:hypothetical protein
MKILYLILHTKKYENNYKNVISTWGKDVDFLFYSDHEDKGKNIIKVSNRDDYHSNEEKFVNVVKQLPKEYLNYDWFFFCDNDTYVNTKLLNNSITKFNIDFIYGQEIHTWTPDLSLGYFSGGAGYLVSNKILRHMIDNLKNYNTGFSDVTFGLYIREHNIQKLPSDLFKSQPPEYYYINLEDTKNYISFHYIKTFEMMNKLYQISNN